MLQPILIFFFVFKTEFFFKINVIKIKIQKAWDHLFVKKATQCQIIKYIREMKGLVVLNRGLAGVGLKIY